MELSNIIYDVADLPKFHNLAKNLKLFCHAHAVDVLKKNKAFWVDKNTAFKK
jgi:hypothetical protein